MVTERPFSGMDAVEQRLRLLDQERNLHAYRVKQHVAAIKDREHRAALLKDAVSSLLHAWRPAEVVKNALKSGSGAAVPLLFQFATTRGSIKRRLFWTALSAIAPALLKNVDVKKVVGVVAGLFRSRQGHNGHAEHALEEEDFTEPWQ
ncbi:MAG TPA: hypothetical protein VKG92_07445 [Flavobacteriales bacterium]|nr:hypothetical protein [Flavobacteriales bacterium]